MPSTRQRRFAAAAFLAVLTTGSAWSLGTQAASAAGTDRYVDAHAGNDASNTCAVQSSPCKTIQHAVDSANTDDTIHVAAGTYPESVLLGAAEHDPANLTIVGAGPAATKVVGYPAGSDTIGFGFTIENVPATLRDLAVTGVQGTGQNNDPGIGVEVTDTQATLTNVNVSGNAGVGVLAQGGAVTASDSTFDNNGHGTAAGFPGCGIFSLGSTASITSSSASSNAYCGVFAVSAQLGIGRAPAIPAPASGLTFTRSTAAANDGPGLIDEVDSAGRIDNSTISGNTGIGVAAFRSVIAINRSTIADTLAGTAGPGQAAVAIEDLIANRAQVASPAKLQRLSSARLHVPAAAPTASTVTVTGSIVGHNGVPDCSQAVTDGGNNLSSDSANSCKFSAAKSDQVKTDPKLSGLGAHGGPTLTQVPLKGSPAIDAIASGRAGCSSSAVDQRGVARPQPSGGRCDVGAVELAARAIVISPGSLPHGTVGTSYSKTITATGGQYPSYVWSLASGGLPDGLSFSSGGVISGTPSKAGTFTFVVSVNDPVRKTYTIVIDAAPAHGNGAGNLADTGTPTLGLTALGVLLLVAGLLALYGGQLTGRPGPRHRHRRA